jgi:hypothetical protein
MPNPGDCGQAFGRRVTLTRPRAASIPPALHRSAVREFRSTT